MCSMRLWLVEARVADSRPWHPTPPSSSSREKKQPRSRSVGSRVLLARWGGISRSTIRPSRIFSTMSVLPPETPSQTRKFGLGASTPASTGGHYPIQQSGAAWSLQPPEYLRHTHGRETGREDGGQAG